MKYSVIPTYAAGHSDDRSFRNLDGERATLCAEAFLRDLMYLEGKGIKAVTIAVEPIHHVTMKPGGGTVNDQLEPLVDLAHEHRDSTIGAYVLPQAQDD